MKMSRRDVLIGRATTAVMSAVGLKSAAGARSRVGKTKQSFDVILVGGRSAGAVLAARLSADARRQVLLLEAGENFAPDAYPAVLKDANIVHPVRRIGDPEDVADAVAWLFSDYSSYCSLWFSREARRLSASLYVLR
jgi:hypothetical protein